MRSLFLFLLILIAIFSYPLPGYAERKDSVVVMPTRAPNLSPDFRKFLTNAFIGELSDTEKYNFHSGKIVSDAMQLALDKQKTKKKCDETACVREVAENFGTNLALTSAIIKEGETIFISAKIENANSEETLAQEADKCNKCSNIDIIVKLKALALKLMAHSSQKAK
tara:strand:- start:384 stop:884 length:501 start_codon:yes stop_codon:yes gene_type:complete